MAVGTAEVAATATELSRPNLRAAPSGLPGTPQAGAGNDAGFFTQKAGGFRLI